MITAFDRTGILRRGVLTGVGQASTSDTLNLDESPESVWPVWRFDDLSDRHSRSAARSTERLETLVESEAAVEPRVFLRTEGLEVFPTCILKLLAESMEIVTRVESLRLKHAPLK